MQAADLRAIRIGVCLAPFRGLARLQLLHVKEEVAESKTNRIGWAARAQYVTSDDEAYVFNLQYGMWMPADVNPDTFAALLTQAW